MKSTAELERAEGSIKVRPTSSFQHKGDSFRLVEPLGLFENFVGNDLEFQPLIFGWHTDDFAAVTGFPKLLEYQRRKGHPARSLAASSNRATPKKVQTEARRGPIPERS